MFQRLFKFVRPSRRELTRRRARTTGYQSNVAEGASFFLHHEERPPFSLLIAELMTYDPKVTIALAVRDGLLMNAEVDITDGRPEVMDFVRDQWDSIWQRDADKLLRTKVFGYLGFEMLYREGVGRWQGRVVYDGVRDFHPRDCRPLTNGGKILGVSVNNVRRFRDQSPVLSSAGGKIPVWRPKSLWLTFGGKYGSLFGESLLEHAYSPWHEKYQRGGAIKLRQLRMLKDAWMGHVIKYPNEKTVDWKTGEDITWRDIARDIVENAMSGAAFGLPSGVDANGNPKWDLQPPTSVDGATQIFEYAHELDGEILEGCQVPAEVLEAMSSGSGFSGRSIPFVSLLAVLQFEFNRYVQAIDEQVLRELVRLNFGIEPRYQIKPKSLIETIGKLMGGQGDQGSDEAGAAADPQSNGASAGFAMPGQVKPTNGFGANGAAATGRNGSGNGSAQLSRSINAKRDSNGQATKSPPGGALVGGVFYPEGAWIPPAAIQFADSAELCRLETVAAIVDDRQATQTLEEIFFGGDRPAMIRLLDRGTIQFADGARAPEGGVSIGGKFYKGGQWIPGEVLDNATPEEKAAVEGGGDAVDGGGSNGGDAKSKIASALAGGKPIGLRELGKLTGIKAGTGSDPLSSELNRTLVAMRDAGEIEVVESEFGEPRFKLKPGGQSTAAAEPSNPNMPKEPPKPKGRAADRIAKKASGIVDAADGIPEDWPGDAELEFLDRGEVISTVTVDEARAAIQEAIAEGDTLESLQVRLATDETKQAETAKRTAAEQEREARIAAQRRAEDLGNKRGGKDWKEPPPKLYHATFSADAIEASGGFKSAEKIQEETGERPDVLGGSTRSGVSFGSREQVEAYAKGLNTAREAARGNLDFADQATLEQVSADFNVPVDKLKSIVSDKQREAERNGWGDDQAKIAFGVLQAVSFEGKKFPLFMGGDWPDSAKNWGDVGVFEVDSAGDYGEDDVTYHDSENEWRIHDPSKIQGMKRVDSEFDLGGGSKPSGSSEGGGAKSKIAEALAGGKPIGLRELAKLTGIKAGSGSDPLSSELNRTLVAMRDAGEIEVVENDFGEPSFKLKSTQLSAAELKQQRRERRKQRRRDSRR